MSRRLTGFFLTVTVIVFIMLQLPRVSAYFYNRVEQQSFQAASAMLSSQLGTATRTVSKNGWFSKVITYTYTASQANDRANLGPITFVVVSRVVFGPLVRDPVSGQLKTAIAAVTSEGHFSFAEGSPLKILLSNIRFVDRQTGADTAMYRSAALIGWDGTLNQKHTFAAFKAKMGGADVSWGGMQINEKDHFSVMKPRDFAIAQDWQADAIAVGDGKGSQFKWDGMTGKGEGIISPDKTKISVDMTVGALQGMASNPTDAKTGGQLAMEKFSWQVKQDRIFGGMIPTGSASVTLPVFSLTYTKSDKKAVVTLKNLNVTGSLTETAAQQYDYDSHLSLGSLLIENPAFSVTDATWDLSAKKMGGAGLQMINSLNANMNGPVGPAQLAAGSQALLAVINPGTAFSTRLNLSTSLGNAMVKAEANWNGAASPQSFNDLMPGATALLDIRLSDTMFNAIRDVVIQGMVEKEMQAASEAEPDGADATMTAQASSTALSSSAPVAQVAASTVPPAGTATGMGLPGQPQAAAAPASPDDIRKQKTDQYLQQLDALIKSGLIAQEKSDYVVSVRFDKGVLTVNGKVMGGPGAASGGDAVVSPDPSASATDMPPAQAAPAVK